MYMLCVGVCCAPSCNPGCGVCVMCSLLMFVYDASGNHMVETYLSMVLLWLCMLQISFPFVFPCC